MLLYNNNFKKLNVSMPKGVEIKAKKGRFVHTFLFVLPAVLSFPSLEGDYIPTFALCYSPLTSSFCSQAAISLTGLPQYSTHSWNHFVLTQLRSLKLKWWFVTLNMRLKCKTENRVMFNYCCRGKLPWSQTFTAGLDWSWFDDQNGRDFLVQNCF